MATLEQALARFGVVTVMEPTFIAMKKDSQGQWVDDLTKPEFKLETLRISNFTQEGPTKTAKGGLNAEVVMRYGKTARLEMEDVVGRIEVLTGLLGARLTEAGAPGTAIENFTAVAGQKVFQLKRVATAVTSLKINGVETATEVLDPTGRYVTVTDSLSAGALITVTYTHASYDHLQFTDKFEDMYRIEGRTFVVNQATGEREYINIFVHKFLPDSLFNMTMEAEGDFGVMNLAGELFTNDCGVFYEFTKGDQPAGC